MAVPKRNMRGLQDIRTLSGRVGTVADEPYRAYMRITCLEMEKARRSKEKESAMRRVNNIDARIAEIEAEKAELLGALGVQNKSDSPGRLRKKSAASQGSEGFKIRY